MPNHCIWPISLVFQPLCSKTLKVIKEIYTFSKLTEPEKKTSAVLAILRAVIAPVECVFGGWFVTYFCLLMVGIIDISIELN